MVTVTDLEDIAAGALGRPVTVLGAIGRGRNGRVFKLADGVAGLMAAKMYLRQEGDLRDRLGVEFDSLRFLWDHGVRCIPQPLASAPARHCAIYEFIDGEEMPGGTVTPADIDAAVSFLGRLRALAKMPESRSLEPASEACFSAEDLAGYVAHRLSALEAVADAHPILRRFLAEEFAPVLREVTARSEANQQADVPQANRTLSPSDFGFHNALRRRDGNVVFLDFEYFGWDDPAKMVLDFFFHPGMELSPALKTRFWRGTRDWFADDEQFEGRVQRLYPLIGLNWCLRLLNEFLPAHLKRRAFASGGDLDATRIQKEQIDKARAVLREVNRHHRRGFLYD